MNAQALRKAAILVNSLDTPSADALLEQMGEEVAALVRNAVIQLDEVSADEQQAVIAEFVQRQRGDSPTQHDEVELSGSLSERLEQPLPEETRGPSAPPFQFLRDANPRALSAHLEREHPQIIAVVLAHMLPEQAAQVITLFGDSLRVDVLHRLAEIGDMNPDMVREIEQELAVVVSGRISRKHRSAGIAAVNAILQAVDDSDRDDLLDGLTSRAPELAREVKAERFSFEENRLRTSADLVPHAPKLWAPPQADSYPAEPETEPTRTSPAEADQFGIDNESVVRDASAAETDEEYADPRLIEGPLQAPQQPSIGFDELHLLSDQALARVLREADAQVRLVALAGAKRELVERLTKPLKPKERTAFEQKLEQVGPLRLQDISYAQQRLAAVASNLVQRGEIAPPQVDRFSAAA